MIRTKLWNAISLILIRVLFFWWIRFFSWISDSEILSLSDTFMDNFEADYQRKTQPFWNPEVIYANEIWKRRKKLPFGSVDSINNFSYTGLTRFESKKSAEKWIFKLKILRIWNFFVKKFCWKNNVFNHFGVDTFLPKFIFSWKNLSKFFFVKNNFWAEKTRYHFMSKWMTKKLTNYLFLSSQNASKLSESADFPFRAYV